MGAPSWDSFLHQLLLHAWSGTSAMIKHSLLDSGDLYYRWSALLQWLRVNGLLTPNSPLSWRHSVLHIWGASEMLFHPISTLFNRFDCATTPEIITFTSFMSQKLTANVFSLFSWKLDTFYRVWSAILILPRSQSIIQRTSLLKHPQSFRLILYCSRTRKFFKLFIYLQKHRNKHKSSFTIWCGASFPGGGDGTNDIAYLKGMAHCSRCS